MRRFFSFLLGATLAAMPVPAQDLIARIHFAGAARISADTNSTAFTNEFCSTEARTLAVQTLDKLSRAPDVWFKSKIAAGSTNGAAQLRPLLDDLLKVEWILGVRDTTNGSPEYSLSIRLDNQRAKLWQDNLEDFVAAWTKDTSKKTPDGWFFQAQQSSDLIFCVQKNGWLDVHWLKYQRPIKPGFFDEADDNIMNDELRLSFLNDQTRSETNWLTADLNWPRLAQLFPVLAEFDFPKIEMQVAGRDGSFHLNGKFILSQPLPPLENWRLPTNLIHTPFVSFTAARGLAPWLARQDWAQRFDVQPAPDQLFVWALPQIPFQTFAAQPVPDGPAALARIDAKLAGVFNASSSNQFFRQIKMEMTGNRIAFTGLPFFSPFMQSVHNSAGDFLLGGFFPNLPRSQPLPPQLLQRLNQPDLVYYHWENTADRLKELPELSQLLLMVTQHRQFNTQSAAGQWLDRIGPALGTSVTEVKQVAPNELAFTRSAPGGLTAVELLALANWLEAPDFPGCNLKLPPRNPRRPPLPAPGGLQPFQLH